MFEGFPKVTFGLYLRGFQKLLLDSNWGWFSNDVGRHIDGHVTGCRVSGWHCETSDA